MPIKTAQANIADIFKDFKPDRHPDVKFAFEEAVKFCLEMGSATKPGRWLTLLGNSGTGKSMLTKKIGRYFYRVLSNLQDEHRPGGIFLRRGGIKNWVDVYGDMMDGDYSGIRDLKEDWFVGLDDIGTEYTKNKDLAVSKLFEILNAREGKFTVINANKTLEQIADWDVRISSRLMRHGSVIVSIDAPDFNL